MSGGFDRPVVVRCLTAENRDDDGEQWLKIIASQVGTVRRIARPIIKPFLETIIVQRLEVSIGANPVLEHLPAARQQCRDSVPAIALGLAGRV